MDSHTLILNIETSTDICSAALGLDGEVLLEREDRSGVNHARCLPVFVDELLNESRSRGLTLDAVAVSSGPGSYTGLRIGVSTAKGLCYALKIPLLAIDTLQAVAAGVAAQNDAALNDKAWLCPMIDARRMEVYTAFYDSSLNRLNEIESKVIDENSFSDILEERQVVFCGNGAGKCTGVIKHPNAVFMPGTVSSARQMAGLSYKKMKHFEATGTGAEDVAYFTPFYLKDFQAAPSHVKGLR